MPETNNRIFDTIGRLLGRSRYIVIIAVAAVMIVSLSLFMLGAVNAIKAVVNSWSEFAVSGEAGSTEQIVESLSVIGVMLRAVVFYIIGVGLYSLFIAPLNLTTALGVESLSDLETKVISVVVVILAVTFLQHFVQWREAVETMRFGITAAIVIAALVLFQFNSRRANEFAKKHNPNVQKRAQKELFEKDKEKRDIEIDEIHTTNNQSD